MTKRAFEVPWQIRHDGQPTWRPVAIPGCWEDAGWPAALAAFEGLAGHMHHIGMRWYAACFTCEWAEALLAHGEPGDGEQAPALLGEAAAEFDAIGAPYYAEQARRRMGELAQPRFWQPGRNEPFEAAESRPWPVK